MQEIRVYKSCDCALSARSAVHTMYEDRAQEKEMCSSRGTVNSFMEEVSFELHTEGWIAFWREKGRKAHPGRGMVNAKVVRGSAARWFITDMMNVQSDFTSSRTKTFIYLKNFCFEKNSRNRTFIIFIILKLHNSLVLVYSLCHATITTI